MATRADVGSAIQERRKQLGLSQVQLATLSDVSRGTIRNLESGAVDPNPLTEKAVAAVLGWEPWSTFDHLSKGKTPVETLPAEPLGGLFAKLFEKVNSEAWGGDDDPHGRVQTFRQIVQNSDPWDGFTDNAFNSLIDFIESLFDNPEDPWHSADSDTADGDPLIAEFQDWRKAEKAKSAKIKAAIEERRREPVPKLGSRIRHKEFGSGTVKKVGKGSTGPVLSVDFDSGMTKRVLLPYAPIEREDEPVDQIPNEVAQLFSGRQVIDYAEHEPEGADNLVAVTVLLKKSGGPLSSGDRKLISGLWDGLTDLWEHGNSAQHESDGPTDRDLAEMDAEDRRKLARDSGIPSPEVPF